MAPMTSDAKTKAEMLRSLHRAGTPLVLPNAWDAASAQAVVAAGFPVVATTSSGVAASLGWLDGEQTPPVEMFAAVGRMARAVDVPVTADIEAGYGLSPDELVSRLLEAGAVGCNLEDTNHVSGELVDPEAQAERISAVKAAAQAAGVDIVLNARVDVFLRRREATEDRVAEAVARGRRYRQAGADCVYPIGAGDEADIAALVGGIEGPVNVLARPGAPTVVRMRELGVARISFGGGFHKEAMMALADRLTAIAQQSQQ
jgi:2-methylisocitrate lyase-like PEP mutase family enzyme